LKGSNEAAILQDGEIFQGSKTKKGHLDARMTLNELY
jgi:hypothetical protein